MSAIITLSVPNSAHQAVVTHHAKDAQALIRELAQTVRIYAARRGVSDRAIEYSVVRL